LLCFYACLHLELCDRGLGIGYRAEGKVVPSPNAASSQTFSVNAFLWRIQGEPRSDHVTRNAKTARNNWA